MWKTVKKALTKLGVMLLRKYGADALVVIQSKAYEKGKKSGAYKKIMAASTSFGQIAKMIGSAGADGEFTKEERAEAKAVWEATLNKIADILDETAV